MDKIRLLVSGFFVCLFSFIINSYAFSSFTNYQSVIGVNDIVAFQGKVWAASTGGLFCIDLKNNTQTLFSDGDCFPDLNLTALALDSKDNLWIGTKLGYLYKRSPDGNCSVYKAYLGSDQKWDITDIQIYRDYVIVASSKGCSIFDPAKGIAIRNTTATDTTGNPMVYAVAVHNDSLYVGCKKGFNAADISGDHFLNNDYRYLSIWKSTSTENPVISFIDSSGIFLPLEMPAAIVNSVFYKCAISADSSVVYVDTNRVFVVPGSVTRMTVDDDRNLWIGTDQNFLFCWNSAGLVQYRIPGLTFNSIVRVHAARNGVVWLTSTVSDRTWWEGISSFDGNTWRLFNRRIDPTIGKLTEGGADFKGICEDRNGNLWFGTEGQGARFYNVQKNQWLVIYVAGYLGDEVRFLPVELSSWSWHDAIVQDSSGYMWFSNYGPSIKTGPLVCYDADNHQTPNYRRFFPAGNDHFAQKIISMSVDSRGKILSGTDDGRLLIVRHNGHPITDGVTVELDKNDLDVNDICSAPNGISWIATKKGLLRYQSDTGSLVSNRTIQTAITCVEAENERVLWLGTSSDGLIRYDIEKSVKTTVDMSYGLVSNSIKDLSVDKKGGYLWIGTTEGVSRYYLGHSEAPVAGNASIVAYPNPFSKSNPNHRRIVFKHCAPNARVLIYSMSGTLVKQLSRESNSCDLLDDNTFETTLCWVPPTKLAPGAYYFVGHPQKPIETKKLLIVP